MVLTFESDTAFLGLENLDLSIGNFGILFLGSASRLKSHHQELFCSKSSVSSSDITEMSGVNFIPPQLSDRIIKQCANEIHAVPTNQT